jgi:hypothetical protein
MLSVEFYCYDECSCAESHVFIVIAECNVFILMLNVVMLSVLMLSVLMLSVFMLSVMFLWFC